VAYRFTRIRCANLTYPCLAGTLLLAVVRYRTAMSQHPDPHVAEWCAEFEEQWGISLGELVDVGFRRTWCAPVVSNEPEGSNTSSDPVASALPAPAHVGDAFGAGPQQQGPRPRSPVYQSMIIPSSHITLPPLQSFGPLHPGNEGGMLPPPPFGQQPVDPRAMPLPDRRVGMPRGLPWLEDELKNGQADASKGR
jgi:hypothetical protein